MERTEIKYDSGKIDMTGRPIDVACAFFCEIQENILAHIKERAEDGGDEDGLYMSADYSNDPDARPYVFYAADGRTWEFIASVPAEQVSEFSEFLGDAPVDDYVTLSRSIGEDYDEDFCRIHIDTWLAAIQPDGTAFFSAKTKAEWL